MLAYPTDRAAYGRLCRLLTQGNIKLKKGRKANAILTFEDMLAASEGQMLIVLPPETISPDFTERLTVARPHGSGAQLSCRRPSLSRR